MMRDDNEAVQIDQVIERLIARFPAEPPAGIELLVRRIHERFADARVRDFVPLLVEKAAAQTVGAYPIEVTGEDPHSAKAMATI
ncbi:three-helix bundle dimerization domain-containing protein [Nocardia sp. NPDC056541]|uniref:three-helix bundle dimerization domain-containing protein n=1 Tax=Nocardia sp. NPDC056541 TaxID=3345860 RepID=UPI00366FF4A2